MDNVQKILANVIELQSMPTVFLEALDSIQDPKINAIKLSSIISKDMALTTKLLRLVNSPYYGFAKEITQVNNAVALLGFRTVKDIIMMMALKPMMLSQNGKDLWEHSLRCAYAAQFFAENIIEVAADEVFTIGFLHDIGRVLFQLYDMESFDEVSRLSKLGIDQLIVEEDIFGADHTVVGEAFVIRENLPPIIAKSIRYHHNPTDENAPYLSKIIYLAEMLTQPEPKDPTMPIPLEFLEQFEIKIDNQEDLRKEVFEKTDVIISSLE